MSAQLTPSFDRSYPPSTGSPRRFSFPSFSRIVLRNGMHVYSVRRPRLPLINLQMFFPAGGQYDGDHPGLAAFHSGLLDEGTERYNALEIASMIEQLGGSLSASADWDVAYLTIELLSRHLASGLELLAEICRSPAFPEEEIERLRQQRLAEILRRKDQPSILADQFFSQVAYEGTVYAQPLIGTKEGLSALGQNDLRAFFGQQVNPEGATLVAVGDFENDDLIRLTETCFHGWKGGSRPRPPLIQPKTLATTRIIVVDRPGSSQTQLQLGHIGIPRRHPAYPTLLVLNTIFGGKFTSRINLNLRERHGFTYGANSYFTRRQGPGPFVIKAAVATESAGAAVAEVIHEMERIQDALVTSEELSESQDFLIGVFPYTLQTASDLSRRLEDLAIFDLPEDYYSGYPECLRWVSREDVQEAARTFLHPKNLAIVAVGPAEELQPQLENLGVVEVRAIP